MAVSMAVHWVDWMAVMMVAHSVVSMVEQSVDWTVVLKVALMDSMLVDPTVVN